jgi:putative tricarboxylic transport membrane protein
MKKTALVLLSVLLLASAMAFANGSGEAKTPADGSWTPAKNVEWVVTSSPGGGSDIFTRMITDIIAKHKLVGQTILVNNQTDGGGEVGRLRVSQEKGDGLLLLTFNSGDLTPMVKNTQNRIKNFRPIAVMAVDRHLLLEGKKTKYATFSDAINAAKKGTKIIIGGSKGDDLNIYNLLKDELGLTEDQFTYIMHDATSDAITALLGGHIDYCISKPASSDQYIKSGDATPVVAFALKRFGGNLADVPLLSEIGPYHNIESPIWRGVVTSGKTPDPVVKYWSDILYQVSQTDEWQMNYIEKNLLTADFMPYDVATQYMQDYENNVLN